MTRSKPETTRQRRIRNATGRQAAGPAADRPGAARTPARPAELPGTELLQPLAWPDPALCSEHDLYLHTHGPAGVSLSEGRIYFQPGAHIQFNTYFNLFNIGKWNRHCGLTDLGLQLRGSGQVELTVFLAYPDRSWDRLITEVITLPPNRLFRLDIPLDGKLLETGLVYFELRALSGGELDWAAWDTRQPPRRKPKLALSITTFRREEAVAQSVARFTEFASRSRLAPYLHMFVVDNGRSAGIESNDLVTAIDNENLGGAGGFTRGLIAARDNGFSHCLFMDDDAATPMDAIERTWAFLAYAHDPATAVAGAMISTRHAWALWENGALFNGVCRPQFGGIDLRDPAQVFKMEYASTPRQPHNFYGGWWYFAFPLDQVKHLPFPFFVRGDDVSFSLVHDFNIQTLPGVVSFQESFTEKDSPLTWYLDLRSHLAHHLSLPSMDIGRRSTLRIALWFWARALIPAHYETMAAVNLALEDVLRGPDFFAENADMAERRARIGAMRKTENWKDMPEPPAERRRINPHKRWQRALMKATLNGHLLPFFRLFGNHVSLPSEARWHPREIWGASEITYRNDSNNTAYTVRHSKLRALREGLRLAWLSWRFWLNYGRLKRQYQAAYPRLTGLEFWTKALALDPTEGHVTETEPALSTKAAE